MTDAHLLVVMGSGETTPTMVTPHQRILASIGDDPRAVLLDTPYGFQENADELSARTLEYFSHNVGTEVDVVELRRVQDADPVAVEQAQATIADADWVFIGPGSPSYLVDQLRRTTIARLLRERVSPDGHGVTVVSSAAAATAGARAIPVYEIYKAGHDAHWLDGLDLLGAIGLDAVLVPHFDNAEGGTHDTRFCYLGERRLSAMTEELDPGTWVLGVDEHTAMTVDLATGAVTVEGRGAVTVRRRDGTISRIESGESTTIDELGALARGDGSSDAGPEAAEGDGSPGGRPATGTAGDDAHVDPNAAPLEEALADARSRFGEAVAASDATAATAAVLDLEQTVRAWAADTHTGDHLDRAVEELRSLITRIGQLAGSGMVDPAEVVGPFVEVLLDERAAARESGAYDAADRIRDGLVALDVELRDSPDGTTWSLTG